MKILEKLAIIFFDYLDKDLSKNFSFTKDVGLTFLIISRQLIKKNITPNKKINGRISKIIEGAFKMERYKG